MSTIAASVLPVLPRDVPKIPKIPQVPEPIQAIGRGLAKVSDPITSIFDSIMTKIWEGSLFILRAAFKIADSFSVFTVSTTDGPVSILWPMVLWISSVLALGLLFWQIIHTATHGGRGFVRLVTGAAQYGIALAVTTGMVGAFLAAADGLTDGILDYSLHAKNFQDALHVTGFGDAISDGIKAIVLGIAAVVGVLPAAIGYVLEMIFREAAILVLVATVPLTAAGLLANVSASWFWRTVRWLLAGIAMKPALALTLALGIAMTGGAQGVSGLLAGIGVLLISLVVPLVLFKLFAFVDPNTPAGAAFRDAAAAAGLSSYGSDSPAGQMASSVWDKITGGSGESDDSDEQEQANTDRFDQADQDDQTGGTDLSGDTDAGTDGGTGGGQESPSEQDRDGGDEPQSGPEEAAGGEADATVPPAVVDGGPTSESGDGDDGDGGGPPPPDDSPDGGGPPPPSGGPDSGPGGGAGAGAGAEDAAVVL